MNLRTLNGWLPTRDERVDASRRRFIKQNMLVVTAIEEDDLKKAIKLNKRIGNGNSVDRDRNYATIIDELARTGVEKKLKTAKRLTGRVKNRFLKKELRESLKTLK